MFQKTQKSLLANNLPRHVVRPMAGPAFHPAGAVPHTPPPLPFIEGLTSTTPFSFSVLNARWQRFKVRWAVAGKVVATLLFVVLSVNLIKLSSIDDQINTSAFPVAVYRRQVYNQSSVNSGPPGSATGSYGAAAPGVEGSVPQTPANKDQERMADISTLHDKLEAFYDTNNYYPSLSELNDSIFRGARLPDVGVGLLQDPDAVSVALVTTPTNGAYAYQPTTIDGGACDNFEFVCEKYTLTAKLNDNSLFSQQNDPNQITAPE